MLPIFHDLFFRLLFVLQHMRNNARDNCSQHEKRSGGIIEVPYTLESRVYIRVKSLLSP